MKNYLKSILKKFKPQHPEIHNNHLNESDINLEFKSFKTNTSFPSQSKGEELFNAFTADIIKKETLFTR